MHSYGDLPQTGASIPSDERTNPMAKGLSDLTDHLFAQMTPLDDPNLKPDQTESEAKRAGAMVSVSDQIICDAKPQLEAAKLYANHGEKILRHLPQVGREPADTAKQIDQAKKMKGRVIPDNAEELAWIEAHSKDARPQMLATFCTVFGRDDVSQAQWPLPSAQSLCVPGDAMDKSMRDDERPNKSHALCRLHPTARRHKPHHLPGLQQDPQKSTICSVSVRELNDKITTFCYYCNDLREIET